MLVVGEKVGVAAAVGVAVGVVMMMMTISNIGYKNSPSFVGDNYYCESSSTGYDDILWDGQQCNGLESPCCTAPNMPWFTTTLDDNTTSDIEVRACTWHGYGHTPVDTLQL